jgi:hypothetical protein
VAPTRSTSPLWPKVYFVTGRGRRKLRQELAAKDKTAAMSRTDATLRRGYSPDHVLHEVLTTEFLLSVWQTVHGRADLELLTVQRRSLEKHPSFQVAVAGKLGRLKPDAMFVFRQQKRGLVCCFVEMDLGTMNPKQIARKYRRYEAWGQSAVGQQYLIELYHRHGASEPRPVFRLLVVARSRTSKGDDRRMSELCAQAGTLSATMRYRVWFTTVAELCRWQGHDLPLEAAIWRKGRAMPNPSGNKRPSIDSDHLPMSLFPVCH